MLNENKSVKKFDINNALNRIGLDSKNVNDKQFSDNKTSSSIPPTIDRKIKEMIRDSSVKDVNNTNISFNKSLTKENSNSIQRINNLKPTISNPIVEKETIDSNKRIQKDMQEKKQRFEQLQEKLTNIMKDELKNKTGKVYKKAELLSKNLNKLNETLNNKYSILSKYKEKLSHILENEKKKNDFLRGILTNLKQMSKKVQAKLNDNQMKLSEKCLDYIKELENKMIEIKEKYTHNSDVYKEIKENLYQDNEIIKEKMDDIQNLKENSINSIISLTSKLYLKVQEEISSITNERHELEDRYAENFVNIVNVSNLEFDEEINQREYFEESFLKLLKETEENMNLFKSSSSLI